MESLSDRDFESLTTEREESECSDDIWEYYEMHRDELRIWTDMPRSAAL